MQASCEIHTVSVNQRRLSISSLHVLHYRPLSSSCGTDAQRKGKHTRGVGYTIRYLFIIQLFFIYFLFYSQMVQYADFYLVHKGLVLGTNVINWSQSFHFFEIHFLGIIKSPVLKHNCVQFVTVCFNKVKVCTEKALSSAYIILYYLGMGSR